MPFWNRKKSDKNKGAAKVAKTDDKSSTSARENTPELADEASSSSSSSSSSSTSSTSIQPSAPVSLPDTRAFHDTLRVPTRMLQDPNAVFVKLPNIATFKDGTRFTDVDMNDAFYSVHEIFEDQRETPAILNETWLRNLRLIPDAISKGADINQAATNGFNCLTIAAVNGFTDAIKFYIHHPDPRLRLNPFWPDANGNVATIFLARNDLNATDGNVAMIHEMLEVTAQLMVPNATEHEKMRAMQRLVDVRDGTNGDTLLRVACYYDNIALVRWLNTYFQCDYIELGKMRSRDGIPAQSALSSAVQPAAKKDFGCLQFLVLEKGLNIAEIPQGSKDPLTSIERAGYTQDGKAMVKFLTRVRTHSVDLFNAVVGQIYLSQNPNVRDALTRFQGLQELFDIHNRDYAGSMKEAIALAKQHRGAITNR